MIELAYWGGLSQSEISEFLHVPLGTVKTRTRSALARLADLLEEELPMSDRFDELVGEIDDPGERERLRRVHELLLSVDAPPELSPALGTPPPVAGARCCRAGAAARSPCSRPRSPRRPSAPAGSSAPAATTSSPSR